MSVLMLISFTHVKCTWNIGKIDIRILHSWFTKNCETYRFSKFAYDDIREVHKRRYLLQPIAIEVFSGDGRNHLLAFPRKIRNKVYAKWVVVIQSTFIVLRTKLCMFDCSKLFSFILVLSWWDFSGYSRISRFRCLSESNENGFKVHFECEFSPFRIQMLTWSHPCFSEAIIFSQ